jgi:hypothetical protein
MVTECRNDFNKHGIDYCKERLNKLAYVFFNYGEINVYVKMEED